MTKWTLMQMKLLLLNNVSLNFMTTLLNMRMLKLVNKSLFELATSTVVAALSTCGTLARVAAHARRCLGHEVSCRAKSSI